MFRIDTETGPGVFETALAYTTATRVADNALLFKYLVKSLGMKYGITPSFMAKPWGNVRVSFPVVIRISDAIMTIGQLPGCSGFVQYHMIHQVPLADGKSALEATFTYLSEIVVVSTSSLSVLKSYKEDAKEPLMTSSNTSVRQPSTSSLGYWMV
jgi:Glutamine synthetase, catalytic domain